ncbi:MAG: DUF4412 domain-containing protein [Gammaproteobacteria bacterium]|nr:DUF4412 domain-containing protein [Gammaproteobacteria bacterium]
MKPTVIGALGAIIIGIGGTLAASAGEYSGPGFSGVAWYGKGGTADQKMGPINVDRPGYRMEVHEQGQNVTVLVLWDQDKSYSLMMDQKMYLEVPSEQTGDTASDFDGEPCDGYMNSKKIGSETVNGRSTEKWRCTGELQPEPGTSGTDSTNWFDREIGFPVRDVKDNGEVFEIRDIAVGRQDASLFKIPAGFKKLDMNAMMQQMMRQQQGQ